MTTYRIDVREKPEHRSPESGLVDELRAAGLPGLIGVHRARLFFIDADISPDDLRRIGTNLLADPVTESATIATRDDQIAASDGVTLEIHPLPGVMDPEAESTLAELRAAGYSVGAVRTGRRYELLGTVPAAEALASARRSLANESIEKLVAGTTGVRPAVRPQERAFALRTVALRDLDDAELESLSRRAHLFLSLAEVRAIQAHYRALRRDPTDLELETLAQTWSEHCVHKTLKSRVVYRGAALPDATQAQPNQPAQTADVELRFENLLKETIVRATQDVQHARRGPECLSVFVDNAGVIGFDDEYGIAFKVETHNRPSAIEPYGGAATGAGGCIRDVLGCGRGARPIAATDVFCVAPSDWPASQLPAGVLHPARVLGGVVRGVADYGNRMGIPTVNGAVHFDPRYLGNPLVFCGCVGLIPRRHVSKQVRAGDRIVLLGGRTGRDGIHGATFSSAELTDTHADEFSHAVQIGNAITEKRVLDAVLRARDAEGGPLFSAITDCGAGGLSSAIGEMAEGLGAAVELADVPLKYPGLRYDEIWISEAQERMVLAVAPEHLPRLLEIAAEEEAEATVIGRFGERTESGRACLRVSYRGTQVGELDMQFLHEGLPRVERSATWPPAPPAAASAPTAQPRVDDRASLARLESLLRHPTIAAKTWIIRGYDHEVQGGSVVKPLSGRGAGPSDAAVIRPRSDSWRGIAVGCGLAPQWSDVDPYWMALAALDEAIRNLVCVGGDPRRTAVLDNFCWGRTDDPEQMGALVRACAACLDGARAFGVPFISGKDSLNNEFALSAADVERMAQYVEKAISGDALLERGFASATAARTARRIRQNGRLAIPPTLLISGVSLVEDVRRCTTSDLKTPGAELLLVGGVEPTGYRLADAVRVHHAVADVLAAGHASAAHDVSEGGWLVSVAEMALGGNQGVEIESHATSDAFDARVAAYVLELRDSRAAVELLGRAGVSARRVGQVLGEPVMRVGAEQTPLDGLRRAWQGQ